MHDHRPGDEGNAAAGGLGLPHHLGNFRDDGFDAALRGHLVAHEAKAGLVALLHVGRDADALHAARDAVAPLDVAQLAARDAARLDHEHGIHALGLDRHPRAAQEHRGAVIGGGVEVFGHGAVHVGLAQQHFGRALHVAAEHR